MAAARLGPQAGVARSVVGGHLHLKCSSRALLLRHRLADAAGHAPRAGRGAAGHRSGSRALPLLLVRSNPARGWVGYPSAAGCAGDPAGVRQKRTDLTKRLSVAGRARHGDHGAASSPSAMRSPAGRRRRLPWMATVLLFLANCPWPGRAGAVGGRADRVGRFVRPADPLAGALPPPARPGQDGEVTEVERARRACWRSARIARDLHDVVAHHMSMVVVQAESAPYRIDDVADEDGRSSPRSRSGARALNEMRGCSACCAGVGRARHRPVPGGRDLSAWSGRPQARACRSAAPERDARARADGGRAGDVPDRAGSAGERRPARPGRGGPRRGRVRRRRRCNWGEQHRRATQDRVDRDRPGGTAWPACAIGPRRRGSASPAPRPTAASR